jgi:osmotically-inducible protein OsmY
MEGVHHMKSVFTFALGAVAGAAAAHFLDPDSGRRRRNQMRDQAMAQATTAASAVQTQAQHAAGVAKGAATTVTPSGTRLEEPDDVTLARKVETHIFRAHDAPKGSVSVDVQAGVAYLRGEASPEWIDRLAAEARQVDGISGVKNLLHAPGTPTPAAEPRFLAAQHYHRS